MTLILYVRGILRCKACFTCKICQQTKTVARSFATNAHYCCAPLRCHVCSEVKERTSYPHSQIRHSVHDKQNSHLRCTACHTCQQCDSERRPGDCEAASRICKACAKQADEFICSACLESKGREGFTANILNNAQWYRRLRVCKSCQNLGFSPKDVSMYKCKNGCKYGHLQFKAGNLRNHKARVDPLDCLVCCAERETREDGPGASKANPKSPPRKRRLELQAQVPRSCAKMT